ncbi:hypothetical protein [Actinacidiphila epipremni]|uniref:Uncharacterized protein n=1 Tax=Actinacidiphila epipremni TaxID=2053013 RepID=A0ABX0ZSH6_9ACTN|nr:hypothetical protein [Actinacidiphila epipremni]NJP46954.1 hypothetical protein [Actinacidiphila epipremni]
MRARRGGGSAVREPCEPCEPWELRELREPQESAGRVCFVADDEGAGLTFLDPARARTVA